MFVSSVEDSDVWILIKKYFIMCLLHYVSKLLSVLIESSLRYSITYSSSKLFERGSRTNIAPRVKLLRCVLRCLWQISVLM